MTKKATDIVAYLSVIGWLIAYFVGDRVHCKFHLNQGLVFAVGELVLGLLQKHCNGLLIGLVMSLLSLALFVLWLIAFIGACKGEERAAPFLGSVRLLR